MQAMPHQMMGMNKAATLPDQLVERETMLGHGSKPLKASPTPCPMRMMM
jgi:hypothetical protein